MEIDGHFYAHSVTRIEVQKVIGDHGSTFVRVKIKGKGSLDTVSFACWGDPELDAPQPEVVVTEIDEREREEEAEV
jgi:hypothetical protein